MRLRSPLLITCVSAEEDRELLPHFLAHYLALGIRPERIRPILNATHADAPGLGLARDVLARYGVEPAEIWIAPYTSAAMWAKRRELQAREARTMDWVISADVDELHEYPEPLGDFLERCERLGVDCAQGVFIDRLALRGRLVSIASEPALNRQFPIQADVMWSLAGQGRHHGRTGTVKLMAIRGHVMPKRGGHVPEPGYHVHYLYCHQLGSFRGIERPVFRFAVPTRVHHFRWTESLPYRLRKRIATPGVSAAGTEYAIKQLAHIDVHGGIALDQVTPHEPASPARWPQRLTRLRAEGRLRTFCETASNGLRAILRVPRS